MEDFESTAVSADITAPAIEGEYIPAGVSESTAVVPFETGGLVPSADEPSAEIEGSLLDTNNELSEEVQLAEVRAAIDKALQSDDAQETTVFSEPIPAGYVIVAEGQEGRDCVVINGVKYCRVGEGSQPALLSRIVSVETDEHHDTDPVIDNEIDESKTMPESLLQVDEIPDVESPGLSEALIPQLTNEELPALEFNSGETIPVMGIPSQEVVSVETGGE